MPQSCSMKIKPLFIWSRFRITANVRLWEVLAESSKIEPVVIWVKDFLKDEPLPSSLAESLEYQVIGANEVTLKMGWRNLFRLITSIFSAAKHADCIVASTHNRIHARIGWMIAKLYRIPIAMVVETWTYSDRRTWLRKFLQETKLFFLRRCDYVFVHGSRQKIYVLNAARAPQHQILIWPHLSQDLGKIKQDLTEEIRAKYSLEGKKVILYLGRIIPRKGLLDLIRACNEIAKTVDNAVLLVGGSVSKRGEHNENEIDPELYGYFDACKKESANCGMKVIFAGEIPPGLSQNYFAVADIFVHPHSDYKNQLEGWGLVINEAASMGLPIVATDRVAAAADLVRDGWNGYVVKAGDVNNLGERIAEILSDEELQMKFAQNSRKVFEDYQNPQRTIDGILRLTNH